MMAQRHLAALLAFGAAVWSVAADAQPYPSRPVTMVVPYAAGGAFDVLARIVGARMGELLGQSVIVENVTGAAGMIGVTARHQRQAGRLHGAVRNRRHARL